jgi:hypothetical protein
MKGYLRSLWRNTLEPVYRWLFRRYFDAILRDIYELRVELHNHIAGINTRQGQVNADVIARLDELDRHVRTVIAAGWDDEALARRMAALEDRLGQSTLPLVAGSETDGNGAE